MTTKNSLQEAAAEILKASGKSGHADPAKAIKDPKENDTGPALTKNTDSDKNYDKDVSKDTSAPTKNSSVKEPSKKVSGNPTKNSKAPVVDNDGIEEEVVALEDVFKEFLDSLDEDFDWASDPEKTFVMFGEYVSENFEDAELSESDIRSLLETHFVLSEEDDEDEDGDYDDDDDDDEDDSKNEERSTIDRLRDSLPEKVEFDVSEDIKAMFNGQNLSEEFTDKATTIFEAAVKSKIKDIQENLLQKYDEILAEEVEAIEESYDEKINDFLKAVVREWKDENEVAIERNLRNELTEEFISGLRNLFMEHYIDVPEEKLDILENMSEEIDQLNEKLNQEISQNVELYKYTTQLEKEITFKDIVSESNLTLSQVEKLKSLAEDMEFDSAEGYSRKLKTLIESYWPKDGTKSSNKLGDDDNGEKVVTEEVNPEIARIAKALSRKLPN